MALQHLLDVYLPLSGHHRYRLPALQVPHPRPHTAWPPHTEAVQAKKEVRPRWSSDDSVPFQPTPLHQPLAHPLLARYGPHRSFLRTPGHRLPEPAGSPLEPPAGRIGLREHLPAMPATEPALEQRQPHLLAPQLGVPLALQAPLVDLPRRAPASGTGRLFLLIPADYFDPPLRLLHPQHDQARQPQPDRDNILLHLTSFL